VEAFADILESFLREDGPEPPPEDPFARVLRTVATQAAEVEADGCCRSEVPTPYEGDFDLGTGVPASPEALRRAFRRMALATHPDRPGGSHEAFLRTMRLYDEAAERLALASAPRAQAVADPAQGTGRWRAAYARTRSTAVASSYA
jgi:hypothetical protein